MDDNAQLIRTVTEIVKILGDCGFGRRADWMSERLAVLTDPSATEDALEYVRGELHGIVPGMGGLLDLELAPGPESTMTPAVARERMRSLVKALFEATR